MTAKTTDFSGLLFYNPSTNGFNPVVSASLFADNTSVNEGGQLNFTVVTWNVPDGTTLYYRIVGLSNMNYNQFTDVNDSVVITNNRGYFSVGILENQLTAAGTQTFDIIIEKTFGGGSQLAIIAGITVNDTSQTPPGGNKVISLNPNYIALQGGSNIPNEVDSGSSAAALSAPFTGTLAQNGTLNFTGQNSALLLPAKNIKTIGMWIKITAPQSGTMYLVDSRVINGSGEGTGYFYSSGFEGWTLMSINGAPADTSNWATIINNTNNWQYVTIINQTNTPHSITLFNRYTLGEGLYNLQVGWVEAWDYILNDTQINTAYLAHSTDYTITTPNALQITVGSVSQGGTTPNNTVALSGVPGGQWTAIRNASSYVGKHGDNTTFSMTYIGDDNEGIFTFGVGTESSFQADSFWYVP